MPIRVSNAGSTQQTPAYVRALILASAVGTLLFNTPPVFLGTVATEFGLTEDRLGALAALSGFVSLAVYGSSFFWIQRIALSRVIVAGLTLHLVASAALLTVAPVVAWAFAVVAALGGALMVVAAFAGLSRVPNATRAFGLSVTTMVLMAGLLVFVIPGWLYPAFGWAGVAIGYLAPGFLLLAFIPGLSRGEPGAAKPDAGPDEVGTTEPPHTRPALAAVIAIGVYFVGLNAIWAFLERIGNAAGIDAATVGSVIAAALIGGAAGSLLAAYLQVGFRASNDRGGAAPVRIRR